MEVDELDFLSSSTLHRRKDCLETDEEARAHPTRNYFFRPNADVDKLIDVCTRKLTTDATNTRALLIRASSYVKRGELELAVQDYTAALEGTADEVDTWYQRGCTYEKLGDVDAAIADFTHVLSLDPNHVKAAYARGTCQNLKGDFIEAIEDYTVALERDMLGKQGPRFKPRGKELSLHKERRDGGDGSGGSGEAREVSTSMFSVDTSSTPHTQVVDSAPPKRRASRCALCPLLAVPPPFYY